MEFPHLGKHCNEKTCNKLDFLPMKCDACEKVFCSTHYQYLHHCCESGMHRDHQVPLCPLCGELVPTAPDVAPDLTVGQHMDRQCRSHTKNIFINQCSFKTCKRKEIIPVQCPQCKRNFCLRHRHNSDHNCNRFEKQKQEQGNQLISNSTNIIRKKTPPNTLFDQKSKSNILGKKRLTLNSTETRNIQGSMNEDEALARAIALSILELDESNEYNEIDRRQNDESINRRHNTATTLRVGGRENPSNNNKDRCQLC